MPNPKFIDLCAGIGGFRMSFNNHGMDCILTCEIDKFCKQTYTENFKDVDYHVFHDDIKTINPKNIEDFDVLCAGFPCQAFSLAGKQKGFADTRGTIFFDVANIIKEKRPPFVIMENVKNLKSHDKGNTFAVINATMDELDYHFHTFEFNASRFVPQKRQRIYMLGLDRKKFSAEFFSKICDNIIRDYNKQKEDQKMSSILDKKVDPKYTLSDKLWEFLQSHANKHKDKGNGFGFGLNSKKDTARTLTARYYKDGSEILIEQKNKNPRKLTPRECARIMGFPDSFKIVCSDTQAYKQFGNSVVVPVIDLFSSNIAKAMKQLKKQT